MRKINALSISISLVLFTMLFFRVNIVLADTLSFETITEAQRDSSHTVTYLSGVHWQSFTAIHDNISYVEIENIDNIGNTPMTWYLYTGTGLVGTLISTGSFNATPSGSSWGNYSTININKDLTIDNVYTLGFKVTSTTTGSVSVSRNAGENYYSGGVEGNDSVPYSNNDVHIKLYYTSAFCGDDIINGDEFCDDGENNGLDGYCNSDCSAMVEYCGNFVIETEEECDDGNVLSGDGCSDICIIESIEAIDFLTTPEDLDFVDDIGIVTGLTMHYETSTTSPDWIEKHYYRIPLIYILLFGFLFLYIGGRILLELIIRWRK